MTNTILDGPTNQQIAELKSDGAPFTIPVKAASWYAGMSERRFRDACHAGKVPGATFRGNRWHIVTRPFAAWLLGEEV